MRLRIRGVSHLEVKIYAQSFLGTFNFQSRVSAFGRLEMQDAEDVQGEPHSQNMQARHLLSCNTIVFNDICHSLKCAKPQTVRAKHKIRANPPLEFNGSALQAFETLDLRLWLLRFFKDLSALA